MLTDVLIALAGLALLTVAADHLVTGASRIANKMRVSPVVVGVVVIGLGTSAPEFLVSGVAAARGDAGIAIGNIVGSNLLNLTLILGVAGLVAPMLVRSSVVNREIPLTVLAVAIFAVCVWIGLDWVTGTILLLLMIGAVSVLLRWARRTVDPAMHQGATSFTNHREHKMWLEGPRAVLGLGGVLVGAQLLVAHASSVATELGVSQVVIGATVVAVGTSLPELVTAVQAQRRGATDLVIGNLFGSNLFNSLMGGALIGFASRSGADATISLGLLVAMVLMTMLAWALLRRGLKLSRLDALILLAGYAVAVPLLMP